MDNNPSGSNITRELTTQTQKISKGNFSAWKGKRRTSKKFVKKSLNK